MFGKTQENEVINANQPILSLAELISFGKYQLNESSDDFQDLQINVGEKMQTAIESLGVECINKLVDGEIPWKQNKDYKSDFLIFLCAQYFRTKAMKENVLKTMVSHSGCLSKQFSEKYGIKEEYSIDWENIYNYGLVCLAHLLSFNLLKKDIHFKLLKSSNARFIVSDQPVYNSADNPKKDFELFYPISPYLALLASTEFKNDEIIDIGDNEVLNYNTKTSKHTYNFFMGKEEEDVNFTFPY